jgi:hypothetical protein
MPRFLRSASACAIAVSVTVIPFSAAARAVEPLDPYQWTFVNAGSVSSIPLPEVPYTATNERNSGILGYHERRFGINLSWVGSAGTGQWTFRRVGGQGQILAHEAVALRNNMTGDYVRYGSRYFGINLKWSSTPVYEWRLGERNGHISLFNITHGDYVIYGARHYGINLRWREDVNNPFPHFGTRTTTVFLARQSAALPGPAYFVRRFGVGFSGRLRSVTHVTSVVPNIDAQALFLKPGRSSSDCHDPAAVVALSRGKTLTKAQMREVFGDDEPRLPVRFAACISTVAATPTTLDLNIKYVRTP